MIVSHEHRFIFVKTRKTAGTSIEVALASLAGDDAIVTPVAPPEPGHRPRNWHGRFNPLPELADRWLRREPSLQSWALRSTLSNERRGDRYFNHMPAALIRARLGRRTWDRYFTFCFERNPWDKVVSMYFYMQARAPDGRSFEEWARTADLPSDWSTYSRGGAVAVDFVGQYDRLDHDLARALQQVGISEAPALPRAKGQFRASRDEATVTDAVDRRVRDVFAREIDQFAYARPSSSPAR